jgi:hypothetical protein
LGKRSTNNFLSTQRFPSFRGVSRALDPFVKRTHIVVSKQVQKYEPHCIFDVKRVQVFLVDGTYAEVGSFEGICYLGG